jgi:hypothetical protein
LFRRHECDARERRPFGVNAARRAAQPRCC